VTSIEFIPAKSICKWSLVRARTEH